MSDYRFETKALHEGWTPDPQTHSTAVPLYLTNAYAFDSTEYARRLFALEEAGNIYTRLSNPTSDVFEKRIAALEGGVGALATSTGHAAIYAIMLTLAACGDELISSSCIYGGAINLLSNTMARSGIKTTFVHPTDLAGFEAAITEKTKVIFAEAVGNPSCDVTDIDALAEIAHRHGIPLVIDNTFPTPYLLRPIEHGADIVIHSSTKYIGGHGTVMGGIVVDSGKFPWKGNPRFPEMNAPDPSYHGIVFSDVFGDAAFITKLRVCTMRDLGFAPSPFNSFMMIQGLETLALRMERLTASARRVTEFLENSPYVDNVRSPYVASNQYYALAQRMLPNGYGGMLSFDLKGGRAAGARFIDALKLIANVANLGDVRTIVSHPASTTHSQLDDSQLASAGISAGTIRVSLGLEAIDDILADIAQALEASQQNG